MWTKQSEQVLQAALKVALEKATAEFKSELKTLDWFSPNADKYRVAEQKAA